MSVCAAGASALSYKYHQMSSNSSSSRQSFTNDIRWVAIGKPAFQEILNTILFKTIFCNGGGSGSNSCGDGVIRHLPNAHNTNLKCTTERKRSQHSLDGDEPTTDASPSGKKVHSDAVENLSRASVIQSNNTRASTEEMVTENIGGAPVRTKAGVNIDQTGRKADVIAASMEDGRGNDRASLMEIVDVREPSIKAARHHDKNDKLVLQKEKEVRSPEVSKSSSAMNCKSSKTKTSYAGFGMTSPGKPYGAPKLNLDRQKKYANKESVNCSLKGNLESYLGNRLNILMNLESNLSGVSHFGPTFPPPPEVPCFSLLPTSHNSRDHLADAILFGHKKRKYGSQGPPHTGPSREHFSQKLFQFPNEFSGVYQARNGLPGYNTFSKSAGHPISIDTGILENAPQLGMTRPTNIPSTIPCTTGTVPCTTTGIVPGTTGTVPGTTGTVRKTRDHSILKILGHLSHQNDKETSATSRLKSKEEKSRPRKPIWLPIEKDVVLRIIDFLVSQDHENFGLTGSSKSPECMLSAANDIIMDYQQSSGKDSSGKEIELGSPSSKPQDRRSKETLDKIRSRSDCKELQSLCDPMSNDVLRDKSTDNGVKKDQPEVMKRKEKPEQEMSVLISLLNDDDDIIPATNSFRAPIPPVNSKIMPHHSPTIVESHGAPMRGSDDDDVKGSSCKRRRRQNSDKERRKTNCQQQDMIVEEEEETNETESEDIREIETDERNETETDERNETETDERNETETDERNENETDERNETETDERNETETDERNENETDERNETETELYRSQSFKWKSSMLMRLRTESVPSVDGEMETMAAADVAAESGSLEEDN